MIPDIRRIIAQRNLEARRSNGTTTRAARPARSRAPAKPTSRELWRKAWAKINAERSSIDRE